MDDLISRQDAIDAVMSVPDGNWASKRYAEELEQVPSARPTEEVIDLRGHGTVLRLAIRTTGEWIVERSGNGWNDWLNVTCSVCGKKFERTDKTNFCPSCGADMRGKDHEHDK